MQFPRQTRLTSAWAAHPFEEGKFEIVRRIPCPTAESAGLRNDIPKAKAKTELAALGNGCGG
jgi:hypothetical protein